MILYKIFMSGKKKKTQKLAWQTPQTHFNHDYNLHEGDV